MGKRMRHSTAMGALAIWFVVQAVPVAAQTPTLQPNPQIQVDYVQPKNSSPTSDPTQYNRYMTTYEWLRVTEAAGRDTKILGPVEAAASN